MDNCKNLEYLDHFLGELIDTISPKIYFSDQPELCEELELEKRELFKDEAEETSAKLLHERIRLNPDVNKSVSDIVKEKFGKAGDSSGDDEIAGDHVWGRKQKLKKERTKKEKMAVLQKKLKEKIAAMKQQRMAKDESQKKQKKSLKRETKKQRKEHNRAKPGAKQKGFAKKGVSNEEADATEEDEKSMKVYNDDGKMIFSKFDLVKPPLMEEKKKKSSMKLKKKDELKKTLRRIEKEKEAIESLKEEGKLDEAENLKNRKLWKNALLRSEGQKVKDNPTLINKSLKKEAKVKQRSAKKWKERKEHVEKSKEKRQEKRVENVAKVKRAKSEKKKKRFLKKGGVIF